jgi:MFS family permease
MGSVQISNRDTLNRRRALLMVGVATTLSLLGDTAIYTVLPTHNDEAGIALVSVGILLSANRFVRLLLNGPIGLLTDRWSRRHIFIPAVYIGAISTAMYALFQGFWPIFGGRLLWGLAWAGLWVSGNAIVLDITGDQNRGRWVGLYHFAFLLGAASGSMLGGVMTDLLGFHGAMALAAGFTFFGATLALLLLPETGHLRNDPSPVEGDRNVRSRRTDRGQLYSSAALYGLNRLVMAGILFATFARFLADHLGESIEVAGRTVGVATVTGLALGMSTLIGMIATPVAGALSDRLRTRWGVISGGLASGITGFALIARATPLTMILGLPLASVSSGSNQGLSTSIFGDLTPIARHGRRLGVLFTIGDLGSAIGPLLAYALLPLIGLSSLYSLCALLLAMMLVVAVRWTIIRPHWRTASAD